MSDLIAKLRKRAEMATFVGHHEVAVEYILAVDTITMMEDRISDLMADKLRLCQVIGDIKSLAQNDDPPVG